MPSTEKEVAATAIAAPAAFAALRASSAAAWPKLPSLASSEALLLLSTDSNFAQYQQAYNRRTMLRPQLRALCKTPKSVAARTNVLPFSLRSGGHSYEGFSQSANVVIDTRLMNEVEIDTASGILTVGAGAALGDIYKQIGAKGFAFSGGSCPTVGVSGHALGGDFGLLARPLGLACNSLQSIELVDPQGRIVEADQHQQLDLFWACRGAVAAASALPPVFVSSCIPLARWSCSALRGRSTPPAPQDHEGLAGVGAARSECHVVHMRNRLWPSSSFATLKTT
jgi:hypothetical protein